MKFFVVLLSFLAIGFSYSSYARPVAMRVSSVMVEELPWETVDAVLRRAAEGYHFYTYSQLVEWYSDALLTVEELGDEVYRVTVYDAEGIVDVVDISML
jgi:hypothetical protein